MSSVADQVSVPTGKNTRSLSITGGAVTTIDLMTVFGTFREYDHTGYYTLICTQDMYVLGGAATPVVIDEATHDESPSDEDEPFFWPANTPMPFVVPEHVRYIGVKCDADAVVRVKRG